MVISQSLCTVSYTHLVAHDEDVAISALEEVKRRANLGFEGVVEETRKSLDDGNTEYMRPRCV